MYALMGAVLMLSVIGYMFWMTRKPVMPTVRPAMRVPKDRGAMAPRPRTKC
jgi:uncharacterized iron-regulated membrane protein